MSAVMASNMILERVLNDSINSTKQEAGDALIESFVFQNSQSIRTSTLILASFNILAAFATAARILYDCYWASKRSSRSFKASRFFILSIHPAETFPLVLSIGIVIQGLVFAGVQGTGLKSLKVTGCGTIAQFMWPALFIVPFIQAIFGLECAIRSLRRRPFQPRGKYDVTICSGIIILMLLGTWVYSHIVREPDVCFACLVWYISRYGQETLILLSACAGIILFSTIAIFIRLSITTVVDKQQRIAASRIVYYNVLGVVSLGLIIPYFASLMVPNSGMKLGMMATVVLNLSGLMAGLLQMFLRSRTATISFDLKSARPWTRGKQDGAVTPCLERPYNKQLASPLPRQPALVELDGWPEISDSVANAEKGRVISMESLENFPFKSPGLYDPLSSRAGGLDHTLPGISESITGSLPGSAKRTHVRNQSYSLFPGSVAGPAKSTLPATQIEPTSKYSTQNDSISIIDELKPPPPIHFGHRRDSSVVSSATVQIGLRISQAPPETQGANVPSPQSPKLIPIAFSFRPGSPAPLPKALKGLSPLRTTALSAQQIPSVATSNKILPAIPNTPPPNSASPKARSDSTIQLSPVAYSPTKKVVMPSALIPKIPNASTTSSPRSAVPPPTMSPKRAPLPNSPRPTASPRSDVRPRRGPESNAGWI